MHTTRFLQSGEQSRQKVGSEEAAMCMDFFPALLWPSSSLPAFDESPGLFDRFRKVIVVCADGSDATTDSQ